MSQFEISPFRALRFDATRARPEDLVAPPYDIISPEYHAELLERSDHNIVRLTLGEVPGKKEDYAARSRRLLDWKNQGILEVDAIPALYVYGCDYTVPGTDRRASFRGLIALGRLFPFEERVVLPHEHTFSDVVDDRYHLLEATKTHLESIFVLYEDVDRTIDSVLEECSEEVPEFEVEAKSGETHMLWTIADAQIMGEIAQQFHRQRPIIADGHHRYTTALQYRGRHGDSPGSGWQPMVFGNLVGDGLSILATHRLVACGGKGESALEILRAKLDAATPERHDFGVESRDGAVEHFAIPAAVRGARSGAAASDYAILHDVVIGEWLAAGLGGEPTVEYFKEGSGEREALGRGDGDVLFRMRPVSAKEFREVVEGGEVFPHKTTFFYPKLWSGLTLWSLEDVTGVEYGIE